MRSTPPPRRSSRARAIAAPAETTQPAAILITLGLIATLLLAWFSLH